MTKTPGWDERPGATHTTAHHNDAMTHPRKRVFDMARDDAPPFARGETYYNGGPIDSTNLGGTNLEGKEFTMEVNDQDDPLGSDPSGRPIRVKVVRNRSGQNLKGARVAHFSAASTAPYETGVDGYTFAEGDRPAGIIDEFLPPAGVVANDLFYLVTEGPSKVTNTSTPGTFAIGQRIVPAIAGATVGDDLAGRVAPQVLTGATQLLADEVLNIVGFAGAADSTLNDPFAAVVKLGW